MWIKLITFLKKLTDNEESIKETKIEVNNIPNRQLCENLLNELDEKRFESYNVALGLSLTVVTLYADVESYTKGLIDIVRLIKNDRPIRPTWIDLRHSTASVDRFLVSADGYYINTATAIDNFKKVGLELCFLMKESDTATYGIHEHNLRMLTRLFINLRHVTNMLILASITNEL